MQTVLTIFALLHRIEFTSLGLFRALQVLTLIFCYQLMAASKARLKLLKMCQIILARQKRNRLPLYSQGKK
jgi:hypothetical protein